MKKTFLLLLLSIFALSVSTCWADNFQSGETVSLSASSSSSRVQLTATTSASFPDVLVYNAGSVLAFFGCGGSTVTAQVPGVATTNATPIAPGAIMVFTKGSATYCAGITSSSTTTLYFTAGIGN